MKKKGLGRGFESLIPTEGLEIYDVTASDDKGVVRELKIAEVMRDKEQPRKRFDETALLALADSIREHGVLQPIVVVRDKGQYRIVAGERRHRAAEMAGLVTIPAIVRELSDQNRLEISLIENVQREDLNALEIATAYLKLKEQFNLTAREIAKRVGKAESSVVNTLRLLQLPAPARKMMVEKGLSEGVMRPLVSADAEVVMEVLPKIIDEGWSARRVEQFVTEKKAQGGLTQAKTNKGRYVAVSKAQWTGEEEELSSALGGARVAIAVSGRGSGKITIKFKSEKELKNLIKLITE